MPVQNSNISMNNIINQSDSYYSDSIISEPKLYATDLQFSITDKELADLFADVPPIKLQINRPNVPLNTPHTNTAVITFSSIEHAEKAYAIYNNTKLEAYNIYLKLHINDPATGIHNDLRTDALILIVKQVNPANTNLTLFDLFRQFGPLFSVRMQYQDNKFKGFAYIQYFRKDDADKAIHSLNNSKQIDNKPLTVQYYVPRNKTQNHSNSNNNAKSMGMPIQYQMNYNNNNQQQQHLQQQQQHQQLPQQPQQQPQGPTSPGSEGPLVDPCNLFIKNLDSSISSSDLFKQFRKYGKIISARVMRDQESSNSKGFGFVSYSTAEEADKAKREMNGKLLGSKSITVRLHEPKKLREAKLANQYSPSGVNSGNNNNNNNLGGGGGGGGGRISSSSNNNNNNNNNENRVPSRRNSELFHINMFNEFTHDDLHSLAPKARREVLMSELKKRFENIPSIPNEQVNPIIEYILNSKTHEILYVLKDPASLQMKIAEARQALFEKKQHGNIGGPPFNITNNNNNANHLSSNHYVNNNSLNNPSTTTDMSNAASQVSQREKFHKAIMKISPVNVDEILDLILTLSVKEKTKCYFNSEYLNKKINEAVQALEVVTNDDSSSTSPSTPSKSIDSSIDNPISNPLFLKSTDSISTTGSITKFPHMRITSTTTTSATTSSSSSTRNVEWEEVEQFMESIKFKALHERKQKLGDRLFPKVKALGLKSAMASKVTINLLDTDDLYELAHSMYDAAKFKAKVEAAEKAVNAK